MSTAKLLTFLLKSVVKAKKIENGWQLMAYLICYMTILLSVSWTTGLSQF